MLIVSSLQHASLLTQILNALVNNMNSTFQPLCQIEKDRRKLRGNSDHFNVLAF